MIIKRINDLKKFIKFQKKKTMKKFIIQKYKKESNLKSVENFFYKKKFLLFNFIKKLQK